MSGIEVMTLQMIILKKEILSKDGSAKHILILLGKYINQTQFGKVLIINPQINAETVHRIYSESLKKNNKILNLDIYLNYF